MAENFSDIQKLEAAYRKSPYKPPDSSELQQRRQQLENNIRSQSAPDQSYSLPPKNQRTPSTDSAWQDVIDEERRAARARFEASQREKYNFQENLTRQNRGKSSIAQKEFVKHRYLKSVGTGRPKPGAEIPHLAVGSSFIGRNFSAQAFKVPVAPYALTGGVLGVVDFGLQVASGEDPVKAAFSATGGALGSFAGGIAGTALGGPIGTIVGTAVAGSLGRIVGENLYNFFSSSKVPSPRIISSKIVPPPPEIVTGGKGDFVQYTVTYDVYGQFRDPTRIENPDQKADLWGPVLGVRSVYPTHDTVRHEFLCRGWTGREPYPEPQWHFEAGGQNIDANYFVAKIRQIVRQDGLPDIVETPPVPPPPGISTRRTLQTPSATPPLSVGSTNERQFGWDKMGLAFSPYTPPAPADIPNQQSKRKPVTIQIPANTPIRLGFDPSGKIPPFSFQTETPATVSVGPAKPNQTTDRIETPIEITAPGNQPINLISPGNSPITLNIPGAEPITIDPNGTTKPTGLTPSQLDPHSFIPTSIPLTPSLPSTTPITTVDLITYLPTALANSVPLQNTNKKTAKEAICEEAQPDGCVGSPLDNLKNLLGNIGDSIASNLPYLIGGSDQTNGALDEIFARLDNIEQKLNQQQLPQRPEINLDEILQKLNRLSEVVGVDEYPASLPPSLITTSEPATENVSIANLTQLFGWHIQRCDEVWGQWEIPIEIKDSDPTTPGDQPTKIRLPNLAEAVAEIYLLLFQNSIDSQTLVNIATRTMLETGQDKQQNYISYRLLQSLVDWAGYKVRENKEELPLLFNPGKTRFDELLVETKVSVPVVEFDEKHSLEADLMRFRKAASILDSVFYRKINPFGDIKEQLMKNLRDKLSLADRINGNDDEAFEKFINDAEIGFGNQPGIDDPNNPYGRPYEQRPRIRDLTNYTPPQQ